MVKKDFDLEHQYQLYLQRVELNEIGMHPEQKRQLRQAFMGACGQMLILLQDEVSKLEDDEAVEVLQNMKNQVGDYFLTLKGEVN